MSKALYHSELVKRGETTLKILGEVRPSKYANKPPFVFVELDGEERALNVENDTVEGKLLFNKGDVIRVRATGSRDNANIEILSGGETKEEQLPSASNGQAATEPATRTRQVTSPPSQNSNRREKMAAAIDDAIWICDDRLTAICESASPDARLETVRCLATTFFING